VDEEVAMENQGRRGQESSAVSYQHRGLAEGRWAEFSFVEQMANVGSEVERAFERSLELLDLTLQYNT
jgi:hypothetical protein